MATAAAAAAAVAHLFAQRDSSNMRSMQLLDASKQPEPRRIDAAAIQATCRKSCIACCAGSLHCCRVSLLRLPRLFVGAAIAESRQLLLVLRVVHRQPTHACRQRRRVHGDPWVGTPPDADNHATVDRMTCYDCIYSSINLSSAHWPPAVVTNHTAQQTLLSRLRCTLQQTSASTARAHPAVMRLQA
jgi:hypothetical protein